MDTVNDTMFTSKEFNKTYKAKILCNCSWSNWYTCIPSDLEPCTAILPTRILLIETFADERLTSGATILCLRI